MEPPDESAREISRIMNDNSFIAMDPPKHMLLLRLGKALNL